MLMRLYGWLWGLARPFLRRHKRLREGFSWRLVPKHWAGPSEDEAPFDVWMQAASGGEAYLAWTIADRLPAVVSSEHPLRLLVTTWTRQGLEILQAMKATLEQTHPNLQIRVVFFPLDSPRIMARALEQAQPRVVVLLETELWPGLMAACARRHIPLLVLNGRMTPKSLKHYPRVEAFFPRFWEKLAPRQVLAISSEDAGRFAALFPQAAVCCVPNSKFDRAETGACTPSLALSVLLPPSAQRRVVLLASVREEEEEEILATLRLMRREAPLVIVVPRHLARVPVWQERLRKDGVTPLLRSQLASAVPAGSLVIWDTFGELGQLYSLSAAVFVGGSLAPLGGQNFLEALAAGRVPCCGPSLSNFAWALGGTLEHPEDTLESRGLLLKAGSAQALAVLLRRQLLEPSDPAVIRKRFLDWLEPRLGGARTCAEHIAAELDREKR